MANDGHERISITRKERLVTSWQPYGKCEGRRHPEEYYRMEQAHFILQGLLVVVIR